MFGVCALLEPVSLLKYVSYRGRLTHVTWVIVFLQIINEGDTHKLIIPEVFPEDSGLFVCKATNDYGIAECTAELYIEGISELDSESDPDSIIEYKSPSPPTKTAKLSC